jgi:hypothetical protein
VRSAMPGFIAKKLCPQVCASACIGFHTCSLTSTACACACLCPSLALYYHTCLSWSGSSFAAFFHGVLAASQPPLAGAVLNATRSSTQLWTACARLRVAEPHAYARLPHAVGVCQARFQELHSSVSKGLCCVPLL